MRRWLAIWCAVVLLGGLVASTRGRPAATAVVVGAGAPQQDARGPVVSLPSVTVTVPAAVPTTIVPPSVPSVPEVTVPPVAVPPVDDLVSEVDWGPLTPDRFGLYVMNAVTGKGKLLVPDWLIGSVSFDPTGDRIAFTARQGNSDNGSIPTKLYVVDVGTGIVTRLVPDASYPEGPAWSPDGRWIAYYDQPLQDGPVPHSPDETVYLLDVTTGATRPIAALDQGRGALEWSPDSTRIAVASPNHGTIAIVDAASGQVHETPASNDVYEVSWSGDGQHLVISDQQGPVRITDAVGANGVVLRSDGRYSRWSPTADHVSMWINTQVWVAPVDGSPPQLVDTTSGSMPVGWSADGRYLTADSGVTAIDVIDMTTGSATTVVTSTNDVHLSAADWAGSGTRFAFVGERSASYRH
ncbi:MAG: hypothetical protein QOG30_1143 [Acidimicrobiaceae bacterium]